MPDLTGSKEAEHFAEGGVFGSYRVKVGQRAGGTDVPMGLAFFKL